MIPSFFLRGSRSFGCSSRFDAGRLLLTALLSVLLASLGIPASGAAQTALSVSVGPASYDLSGVGTNAIAAARLETRLLSRLSGQLGLGFFWYRPQGDRETQAMLLPEVGVQIFPVPSFPVYLAAGVGGSIGVAGGGSDDFVLYAALGGDIEDRGGWAIRPELRMRVVDPWVGTIGEFTLGVRRRFGPA